MNCERGDHEFSVFLQKTEKWTCRGCGKTIEDAAEDVRARDREVVALSLLAHVMVTCSSCRVRVRTVEGHETRGLRGEQDPHTYYLEKTDLWILCPEGKAIRDRAKGLGRPPSHEVKNDGRPAPPAATP